jgi:hypothetical protein
MGERLRISRLQASIVMKKRRTFRDATQIAAKLGLEVGQRWRVGG